MLLHDVDENNSREPDQEQNERRAPGPGQATRCTHSSLRAVPLPHFRRQRRLEPSLSLSLHL